MTRDWLFEAEKTICNFRSVGVLVNGGKVLLQRDRDGNEYALPGGHVQIGETSEAALIREYKEETGAEIQCRRLLWTEECFWKWGKKSTHTIAFYYLIELSAGSSIPDAGEFVSQKDNCNVTLGWMPIAELKNLIVYPAFLADKIADPDAPPEHFVTHDSLVIRPMLEKDIAAFPAAFARQNWQKPKAQFEQYFAEQQAGKRQVFVAEIDGTVAGYATLLPEAANGPWREKMIPEIVDFNVLIPFQRRGVGSAIMNAIESEVRAYSRQITLAVGLHSGYGAAQRLYAKRGYLPDGSGVWYDNQQCEPYGPCCNNDDLVLYLIKKL